MTQSIAPIATVAALFGLTIFMLVSLVTVGM
ncbi:hypothetical protein AEAC466_12780 [Asticcacaulis sp. AC466]|nr:hypothetical protein AEAC466_12780 [Asticcacaulis sp. AC466]